MLYSHGPFAEISLNLTAAFWKKGKKEKKRKERKKKGARREVRKILSHCLPYIIYMPGSSPRKISQD